MSVTGQEKRDLRGTQFAYLGTVLDSGWIKDFSLAIDGGANIGNWAIRMATRFARVIAFEPAPMIYAELLENTRAMPNIECQPHALLDQHTAVKIMRPAKGKSLRSLYVQANSQGNIRAVAIDSLELTHCGFIKLDLEGAECRALLGARQTIAKFRPVLMLEMDRYGKRFGNSLEETERLVASMGYVEVGASRPDRVYAPVEGIS